MQESTVLRQTWLAVAATTVLFRNNAGKAWLSGGGKVKRLTDGSVVVPFARPIALGLAKVNGDSPDGIHDTIGYTSMIITSEMVGRRVAVFTSLEIKESEGGVVTDEQLKFCETIRKAGGISGIASSPGMAQLIINEYSR